MHKNLRFNAYLFDLSLIPPRQAEFWHWSLASTGESLLVTRGLDKDILDFPNEVVNVGELVPDALGHPLHFDCKGGIFKFSLKIRQMCTKNANKHEICIICK